jgi:uridine phosphorylase
MSSSGRVISQSELIVNDNGSVFHLHLLPGQLSDKIILVGDPDRVTMVATFLDSVECDVRNREFHSVTGSYKGKRVSVVSHGIGTDNIDIVLTELDALFNIDLSTRQVKDSLTVLTLIRVGTSGSLQPYLPVGSHVISAVSVGLDTVLHYYSGSERVIDEDISEKFMEHLNWNKR